MTANRRQASPLCVVRVGLYNYVVPLREGLALVQIMERALPASADYLGSGRTVWRLEPQDAKRPVELTTIRAADIIPHAEPARATIRALPSP
jgi:hypothetical protein